MNKERVGDLKEVSKLELVRRQLNGKLGWPRFEERDQQPD